MRLLNLPLYVMFTTLISGCEPRDGSILQSKSADLRLAPFTTLIPVSDGDAATDDRGWARGEINATSFRNQALVTVGDHQLTSYYGADGALVIARRRISAPTEPWDLLRTGFRSHNVNDPHNVSAMAIDGHGRLHMAWGVHSNPLLYARSMGSVVNDDPILMSDVLMNQIRLQSERVTYPEFWNVPGGGDLLLSYRTGGSGNGEHQLSRWHDDAGFWLPVHVGLNAAATEPQPWIDNDGDAGAPPNVSAYLNGLVYDAAHRLHMTWTWRTGGDSTSGFGDYQSNHDLMYAYSDDDGMTWWAADGTPLERDGRHDIDEDIVAPALHLPEGSSLINQTSSAVGADGTLYVATWFAPDAAAGNHLREYVLLAYADGRWTAHRIGRRRPEDYGVGTKRVAERDLGKVRMSRPVVAVDEEDRVYVVFSDYQRGQGVTVAVSERGARDGWRFIELLSGENAGLWEPKYDLERWRRDGVLSLFYQPSGHMRGPTPVSILEWDARAWVRTAF